MKKTSKALLLALCAVLLVAASVMGTMAYLTSSDTVTNTFTVGKVAITLDEAPVGTDGKETTGERVNANEYHLLPGHEYDKDPTVHVEANSEDSWIFVKVENGISAYESKAQNYKSITAQITEKGWTLLDGTTNVYYRSHVKVASETDYVVFERFTIDGNAQEVTGWKNITAETTKVTVTAYAVQKDGFTTAKAAWDATFGA